MTNAEIKQAMIAHLAAQLAAAEPGSASQEELLVAAGDVLEVRFDASFTLRPVMAVVDIERMIKEQTSALAKLLEEQATVAVAFALDLFVQLARDFGEACPDVDVAGFLQRAALSVAAEDDHDS